MSEIRVRFAPSPTGYLHIGGARTALFNWLFAHHHGGKLILRIEDTDIKRNTEEAAAAIYEGLGWLGLNWDEGPHIGGDLGPYFQSQRSEIYERYLKQLQDAGHIFEDQGALRFRSPREHVVVEDLVCGRIDFDLTNPGTHPDMTIRRPDGSWIFHFVNVIDDIEMKISHVIRGEDHLSNTPKHIELYKALGATPPVFAHIPLILNRDGSKMSKRDQGASLNTYIEGGYVPEAVRNYLCLLGWSPKDNREKIDIAEVVKLFELEKINRRNAAFDLVTRGVRQDRELESRDCRVDPKKSCPKARLQDWRSCSSGACCGERSQRRPESLSYARSDGERARARAVRPDDLTAGRGMKR